MGKDNKKRRDEKKKKEKLRQAKREQSRREHKLPDLTKVPDQELLQLFPSTEIDSILGGAVSWKIYRTQQEVLNYNAEAYNTCVTTDMHIRLKGVPEERHPLHQYYASYADKPDFARLVGYVHNQVIIEGRLNGVLVAKLHLAGAYPSTLYMHDIELANPNVPATRPLFPDQNYPGIGQGVFAKVIERLRAFGQRMDFKNLTAFAADEDRARIFTRKGFQRDVGQVAELAALAGHQIPLLIRLEDTAASS